MENKEFIVCIDSDGCALDTMNYKHLMYFGPIAVQEWKIKNAQDFLKKWNYVNLFSENRGCNRFIGLYKTFELFKISNKNCVIDLKDLKDWLDHAVKLSNDALSETIKKTASPLLEKILHWSLSVNQAISEHKGEPKAFANVVETVKKIFPVADIAIVSSANTKAIEKEWQEIGLLSYVKYVFGQEKGTKKNCIALLLTMNYQKSKTIMIGDSPGDYLAAKENAIWFFPILFDDEKSSWKKFKNIYFEKFITSQFNNDSQTKLLNAFFNNMKKDRKRGDLYAKISKSEG